jgi:hypothetical protein
LQIFRDPWLSPLAPSGTSGPPAKRQAGVLRLLGVWLCRSILSEIRKTATMMPSTHLIEIVQDLTNGNSKIRRKLFTNCHIPAKVWKLPPGKDTTGDGRHGADPTKAFHDFGMVPQMLYAGGLRATMASGSSAFLFSLSGESLLLCHLTPFHFKWII